MNKIQYICIFFLVLVVAASAIYQIRMAGQRMTPEGFLNPIGATKQPPESDPHYELPGVNK